MEIRSLVSVAALTTLVAVGHASAAPVLTPLDPADYITVGALDWAWAAPISSEIFVSNTLYQAGLHDGWREATDSEWAARPAAAAFNGKCASKYWNSVYDHCDFNDPVSRHWEAGATDNYDDLWYVRDAANNAVPEPGVLALVSLALVGLALRRNQRSV